METGYDIIFFWVARMMMLGIHLTDAPPFQTVYLSGLIRDPYGAKMSKTKGNVGRPAGDDRRARRRRPPVRAGPRHDARAATSGSGPAKVENARNFANKLWNATRFVLGARPASIAGGRGAAPARRRATSARPTAGSCRAPRATTAAVDKAMADYDFGEVTRLLYDAIWNEYCDWGLELAKVRLADASLPAAEREATWWALVEALDTYLRLLHPVMPFITETLWAALPHRADGPGAAHRRPLARGGGARPRGRGARSSALVELVRAVRNARADARARARRLAAARRVRGARARACARGAAPGRRAAGPRAPAPPPPHPRGPPRDGRRGRRRRSR